jgi:aspartate/methionine/tyrosine aminotransferase
MGDAAPAINPLVADTGTPPIPEAQAWAQRYDGAHGPLLNMSQAVPGYPPHPDFMARLTAAAHDVDIARYGPITGDADLRAVHARQVSALYGAAADAADVAITAGCNLAAAAALMLVAKAGDAVLVPVPWYFNHPMWMGMLGLEARPLPCDPARGFVPDPDEAERLIDERVKAVLLVTPNNPTGAIYPASVLERFRDLCRGRGLWLIIDETYRDFLPPAMNRPHALFADEAWRDTCIQLYSFSKAYCMPGYRLGAIVADRRLIREVTKILDCIQICAPRIGQSALVWGIDALADWREENRREMHARGDAFGKALATNPAWRLESLGAYFAYVRHPYRGLSAETVGEALAVQRGVLGLPGSYFGAGQERHLRMAFGNIDTAGIESLVARLEGFTL